MRENRPAYRSSAFSVAVLGVVSAIWCSAAYPERPPLLTEFSAVILIGKPQDEVRPSVPVKYASNLFINTSVSYRVAVQEHKQAGLKDLCDLTENASLEEHWVFLPDKDLWLEIGYREKPGSVGIDHDYLERTIKENDEMAIYHIHPRSYLRSMDRKGYSNIPETWLTLPSLEDVALMIYYSSRFYDQHPQGRISWYLCSPLGITEYALTEKGINHYRNIEHNTFLVRYFHPCHTPDPDLQLSRVFDITAPHTVQDLMDWVNSQGEGYLRVDFTPYPRRIG